jgi:hypothetical protein
MDQYIALFMSNQDAALIIADAEVKSSALVALRSFDFCVATLGTTIVVDCVWSTHYNGALGCVFQSNIDFIRR